MLDRASPEFKHAVTIDQLDHLFDWFRSLGPLERVEPPRGQATMSATTQSGERITADYVAKANFEKGNATIKLGLIKHGDQWQILRFSVDSPALMPH